MIITEQRDNLIDQATSDDGSIQYLPIGNDRLIIDGRDAYHGCFDDTHAEVPAARWLAACELMREVNDHNAAVRDEWRRRHYAEMAEQEQRLASDLSRVRGGYNDPNTF